MAAVSRVRLMEQRLREIEREQRLVNHRIRDIQRWADGLPEVTLRAAESALESLPVEELPPPLAVGVLELEGAAPEAEEALEVPAAGLDVKRVVMPSLQRTDMLRPSLGGKASPSRLTPPEHDRLRGYFGVGTLRKNRQAERENARQRMRVIFMLAMVLILGYILFRMVT